MTKHGALGFAEWLTLNYGHQGIRVSCLCPNAVYTGMFGLPDHDEFTAPPDGGQLGRGAHAGGRRGHRAPRRGRRAVPDGRHPRVGDSFLRKATDYDAWIANAEPAARDAPTVGVKPRRT